MTKLQSKLSRFSPKQTHYDINFNQEIKVRNLEKKIEPIYIPTIVLVMIGTILIYLWKFHNAPISDQPADWGVLGDYFGGILNPIISFTALIYLIKAYSSQKQELAETKLALRETAEHNSIISNTQKEQRNLMEDTYKLQQASMIIEIHYKEINLLQDEIKRASECKYENSKEKGYKFKFYSVNGHEYDDNRKINEYIQDTTKKINELLMRIKVIEDKITSLTANIV